MFVVILRREIRGYKICINLKEIRSQLNKISGGRIVNMDVKSSEHISPHIQIFRNNFMTYNNQSLMLETPWNQIVEN